MAGRQLTLAVGGVQRNHEYWRISPCALRMLTIAVPRRMLKLRKMRVLKDENRAVVMLVSAYSLYIAIRC